MKQLILFLGGLIMAGFLMQGCKKYEEGPLLSLRSKTARVLNEWKIAYAYDKEDSVEITSDFTGETWEFTKDGDWIERDNGVVENNGSWEFADQKEGLNIMKSSDIEQYDILKLKADELWLQDMEEELHLVPVVQ